jgi:hypothetical protein
MKKKDAELSDKLRLIARTHTRYGYRRATALIKQEGEAINPKRVYRSGYIGCGAKRGFLYPGAGHVSEFARCTCAHWRQSKQAKCGP